MDTQAYLPILQYKFEQYLHSLLDIAQRTQHNKEDGDDVWSNERINTYALLQRGDSIRTYDPIHPPSICDMTNAYDTNARPFKVFARVVILVKIMFDKEQVL